MLFFTWMLLAYTAPWKSALFLKEIGPFGAYSNTAVLSPPVMLEPLGAKLFLMPIAQSPGFPPLVAQPEAGAVYHDASTTTLSLVPLAPMPPDASIGAALPLESASAITVRSPDTVTPPRSTGYDELPPVMWKVPERLDLFAAM